MTVMVIVTACASFGLMVSEAKTKIMRVQTKYAEMLSFNVTAAGQMYKKTAEFVYLGGAVSANWDLSIEVTRRFQRGWTCFGLYKMEPYDRLGVRLQLKMRGMYLIVLFRNMPWHCRGTTCLPGHTTETFHGPNPNPNPRCHGHCHEMPWGAVPWGLPWRVVGFPWSTVGGAMVVAAGVAMVLPMVCHGTPHGVPWNPMPRHGMLWGCHGMPWYAMGGTMAMPRHATKK